MNKPKLIYIAGSSRSGSTLLASLLSEADNSIGIGEPILFWSDGIEDNFCACGEKLADCAFWGRVLNEHFQSSDFLGFPTSGENELIKVSQSLRILFGRKNFVRPEYLEIIEKLYSAIYQSSGAKVIIDESKFLPYLYALIRLNKFDVRVIHILRDPRAVAFSWQRLKSKGTHTFPKFPWHVAARHWLAEQFLFFISHCFVPKENYLRVRYEDFIEQPQKLLSEIFEKTGLEAPSLFNTNHEFEITHTNHFIASNPSVPQKGANRILKDMEWKRNMPFRAKILVTLICWPMMLVYGYPVFWGQPSA